MCYLIFWKQFWAQIPGAYGIHKKSKWHLAWLCNANCFYLPQLYALLKSIPLSVANNIWRSWRAMAHHDVLDADRQHECIMIRGKSFMMRSWCALDVRLRGAGSNKRSQCSLTYLMTVYLLITLSSLTLPYSLTYWFVTFLLLLIHFFLTDTIVHLNSTDYWMLLQLDYYLMGQYSVRQYCITTIST